MTVAEIYDYNIGDIYDYSIWTAPPASPWTTFQVVITNKYYSPLLDTVFYVADYSSYTGPGCPPPCTGTYYSSTSNIFWYTNLNDTLGTGPLYGNPLTYTTFPCIDTTGYTGNWVDSIYYDSSFCNVQTTLIQSMGNGPFPDSTGCYWYFEPEGGYTKYSKGLGERVSYYNSCTSGFPNCEYSKTLFYYKKAADSCGTFPGFVGINENYASNGFAVYPNPSSGIFDVRCPMTDDGRIEIINVLGEIVFKSVISRQTSVNLSSQPNGIYFLRLTVGDKVYSQKIVKE